jgi:hypothetical protein
MLLHVSVNECFSAVLAMKLRLVQNVSCYTVKFLWNVDTLAIWTFVVARLCPLGDATVTVQLAAVAAFKNSRSHYVEANLTNEVLYLLLVNCLFGRNLATLYAFCGFLNKPVYVCRRDMKERSRADHF